MLRTATCCHISRTSVKTELCTVVCNREHLAPKTQKGPHQQNLWILWQWAATLAESPPSLKPWHPSWRLSNLLCWNMEMSLVLVCVITMIAVMMIMHPFCPPWNERWNKLMEACVFLFGSVTRWPNFLYQEKFPGHFISLCLYRRGQGEFYKLFQEAIFFKKSHFLLVQWHQKGQIGQHCWGSALVLLVAISFIAQDLILRGPKNNFPIEGIKTHQF